MLKTMLKKVLVIYVGLVATCISSVEATNDTSMTTATKSKAPSTFEPSSVWAAYESVDDAAKAVMAAEPRDGHQWRLPNTSHPLHYFLHITTNIHRGVRQFEGNCTVDIHVDQRTEHLVLNALFLRVLDIFVEDIETRTYLPNVRYSQVFDTLLIGSEAENGSNREFWPAQRLRVTVLYSGHIWGEPFGLHTIRYQDAGQQLVVGAATLFQPIYARAMFPCYDEPRYRANFTVRVTHGRNFTALSNMPEAGVATASVPGMCTTTFLTTPSMPSYLLAITLSTYVNISAVDDAHVLHRLFKPSSNVHNFQSIIENGKSALKALSEYFQVPYALPKLDSFIEPRNEYQIEGMENWGLVAYNDKEIPQASRNDIRKHVNFVILQYHEIAHQWFGNLVTPTWWNHLWLSEGFATYYSYRLLDLLQPDYEAMDLFQMDVCHWPLSNFYLNTEASKPQFVGDNENWANVDSIFNILSYNRAPCIIQMFDHALGKDVFHKGIVKYLNENSYAAVEPNDLYKALQSAMEAHYVHRLHQSWNYSVHELMQPWAASKGCPLITVTRNYDPANVHLVSIQQTPMSWLDTTANASAHLWWIPLNFATQSQADFTTITADLFMPPIPEMTIDLRELNMTLRPDDWLVVNKHAHFYYHVKYDARNLRRMASALQQQPAAIPRRNRWQILHTLYELLIEIKPSGRIATNPNFTDDFLELHSFMQFLANDDDLFVWSLASQVILHHYDTFRWPSDDVGLSTTHRLFVANLLSPTFERYRSKSAESSHGLSAFEQVALPKFMELACYVQLPACLEEAKTMVLYELAQDDSAEQPSPQPSSLMLKTTATPSMLCGAAANLSDIDFKRALIFYTREDSDGAWWNLSCTRKRRQFARLLQWAGHIRSNDSAARCADKMEFMASLVRLATADQQPLLLAFVDEHLMPARDTNPCFMKFCNELISFEYGADAAYNKKVKKLLQVCEEHRLNGTTADSDSYLANKNKSKTIYAHANVERIYEWLQEANAAFVNTVNDLH